MAVAQQYHQNVVHFLRREVNYNDPGVANGIVIGRLPANAQILQTLVRIKTGFNAGTTNVLTVGTNPSTYDNLLGTTEIAEGSLGNYQTVNGNLLDFATETDVVVKYTQTGTAATAGRAIVHLTYTVNNG